MSTKDLGGPGTGNVAANSKGEVENRESTLNRSSSHSNSRANGASDSTQKSTRKVLLPGNTTRKVVPPETAPASDGRATLTGAPSTITGGSRRWNTSTPITAQAKREQGNSSTGTTALLEKMDTNCQRNTMRTNSSAGNQSVGNHSGRRARTTGDRDVTMNNSSHQNSISGSSRHDPSTRSVRPSGNDGKNNKNNNTNNNSNRSTRTSGNYSNSAKSARKSGNDNTSNRSARTSANNDSSRSQRTVGNENSQRSQRTSARNNDSNRSARTSGNDNSQRSQRTSARNNDSNRSARTSGNDNSQRSHRTSTNSKKELVGQSSHSHNHSFNSTSAGRRTSLTNSSHARALKSTFGDNIKKSNIIVASKNNSRSATRGGVVIRKDLRSSTKRSQSAREVPSKRLGMKSSSIRSSSKMYASTQQSHLPDAIPLNKNVLADSMSSGTSIRRKSTSDIPIKKSKSVRSIGNNSTRGSGTRRTRGESGVVINKDMRRSSVGSKKSGASATSKHNGMDISHSNRSNAMDLSQSRRSSAFDMDLSRSRRSTISDIDMSRSNRARIEELRAARQQNKRSASYRRESDLTPEEERIQALLANRSYHLPGNNFRQDWVQYFCNNHPLFAICCSHRLHPISKWMLAVALLGSVMIGLVITNAVYLLLIHDNDPLGADNTPVFELSAGGFAVQNGTKWIYLEEDGDFGTLYELTAVEVSSGMVILWTAGGAIHAIFDNVVWYATSCACFTNLNSAGSGEEPGWCARCLTKYKGLCNFLIVTSVLFISALASLAVVVRAHVEGGGDVDSAVQNLQSTAGFGSGGATVKGADTFTDASNYEYLMAYSIELLLAWFLWYPLIETIIMTGIIPCFGRPIEMKREKERALLPR